MVKKKPARTSGCRATRRCPIASKMPCRGPRFAVREITGSGSRRLFQRYAAAEPSNTTRNVPPPATAELAQQRTVALVDVFKRSLGYGHSRRQLRARQLRPDMSAHHVVKSHEPQWRQQIRLDVALQPQRRDPERHCWYEQQRGHERHYEPRSHHHGNPSKHGGSQGGMQQLAQSKDREEPKSCGSRRAREVGRDERADL